MDVDAEMKTCSDIGSKNTPRSAACTAVIQPSAADPTNRSRALNNRCMLLGFQGDADHAIADYDAPIAIKPHYADGFYNRAKAWRHKGDAARADADAAETVRLDPGLKGR